MVRMRRYLMISGQRNLSKLLKNYFDQKLNEMVDRVEGKAKSLKIWDRKDRDSVDVSFGTNESIWREAIESVLGTNTSIELLGDYAPVVQSVAAKANQRTAVLIGEEPSPQSPVTILRRSHNLAREVTKINETTRRQLVRQLDQALEEGKTLAETASMIRNSIPTISANRIPTIVRTEIGRAIDEGTKQAIIDSPTVKYVDVIRCTGVEPNIPTFDGRPTCNIKRVPANRVDELKFHPNHTGTIVPSGYE